MDTNNQTKELFLYEEMKRGKEYVFDFFFNYYYPGLCVYAQKMISLPEEQAKDIVQDVFVKFWNDRGKFRVERFVTSPLPHRPVRAAFPHTVPLKSVSLLKMCDKF